MAKMYKVHTLLFCLFLQMGVSGQAPGVSIYEYGQPLDSCESNFINLFNNWPGWVANHQETVLLSYKYIETLKDSTRKASYIPFLVNPELLVNGGSSLSISQKTEYTSPDKVKTVDIRNRNVYILPGKNARDMYQNVNIFGESGEVPQMKVFYMMLEEVYRTSVAIGDKVYAITIRSGSKEYTNYVFCRPGSNKVVFDKLFYSVKMM